MSVQRESLDSTRRRDWQVGAKQIRQGGRADDGRTPRGLDALAEDVDDLEANQIVSFKVDQDFGEFAGVGTFVHLPDEVGTDASG